MDVSRLNEKQLNKAEEIMVATKALRRKVTLYRKEDMGLALFRITACNMIQDAVIFKVLNRPWTKKITSWIEFWNDSSYIGDAIQELFNTIKEYKRNTSDGNHNSVG